MKKKLLLTFLVLISLTVTKAQNTHPNTVTEFKDMINFQFSKIITGNSFSNFGNYASIKTTDESLKASVCLLTKKESIINIEASGGALEGVSAYFNNGELNSNISLNVSYHFIVNPFKTNSISRNVFERDKLLVVKAKTISDSILSMIAVRNKKDFIDTKIEYDKSIDKFKSETPKIDLLLKKIDLNLKAEIDDKKKKNLKFKIDSLSYEKEKIEFDTIAISNKFKLVSDNNYYVEEEIRIHQKTRQELDANAKSVKILSIESIDLTWISLGCGIKKDEFKLFDPTLDYANQIIEKNYTSNGINLALSRYKWKSYSPDDIFWSLGVNYNYTHNLGSLKNIEIIDTKEVSQEPQRDEITKQHVFTGTYKEDLNELTAFFDYYRFFGVGANKNSVIALHLNPKVVCKDETKPLTSIHTGIMIPFKKTGEESSFANLEVFYKLSDIFNNSESEDSLLGRNTIGLRITFPINFLLTKN